MAMPTKYAYDDVVDNDHDENGALLDYVCIVSAAVASHEHQTIRWRRKMYEKK